MADGWGWFIGKIVAKTAAKIALNALIPGSGAALEFAEAVKDFCNGDVVGGLINTVSGIADVATAGLTSSVMEVMEESTKKAVVDTAKSQAKSAAKEATKKVGQELSKQLAKETITSSEKEVLVQATRQLAKTASKKATKEVGQKISKELAKGVVSNTVERAILENTIMTVAKADHNLICSLLSSGGKQGLKVLTEHYGKEAVEQAFNEIMKENKKQFVHKLTGEAAKRAAKKELALNAWKFMATDYTFATVKGAINTLKKEN